MSPAERYARRAAEISELLATCPLLHAINFHNTSRDSAGVIEKQLELCGRHFSTVNEDDLDTYLGTGLWHKPKPGMILAFYEGYRNGYDVILPLLEKYRLTGWFFCHNRVHRCITGRAAAVCRQTRYRYGKP